MTTGARAITYPKLIAARYSANRGRFADVLPVLQLHQHPDALVVRDERGGSRSSAN